MAEEAANDSLEEGVLDEHPVKKRAVVVAMARTRGYMAWLDLFFNKNAGRVDQHVGFGGPLGYFSSDDERAKFFHSSDPFEAFLERFSSFVDRLHCYNGRIDNVGVIAAYIPRSFTLVAGSQATRGQFLWVAQNHDGPAVHKDIHAAEDVAGEGDLITRLGGFSELENLRGFRRFFFENK